MEGKAKPEYEKCVEISTRASIREMIAPGALAIISPALIGFLFGPEALGGLLAGITVSGVLMGMFQNNAGGAWDNAKKSFEKGVEIEGKMEFKGSEPHKASVTGDTVGDPFKDTSGPSMNILIKLTSIVALIIAPHIHVDGGGHSMSQPSVGGSGPYKFETIHEETAVTLSDMSVMMFHGSEGTAEVHIKGGEIVAMDGRPAIVNLVLDESEIAPLSGLAGVHGVTCDVYAYDNNKGEAKGLLEMRNSTTTVKMEFVVNDKGVISGRIDM